MIKIHLSRIMGEKRLKISDVALATGINRGTITRLYHETAERVDLDALDALCAYFGCGIDKLLERIPGERPANPPSASEDAQEP